MNIPNQISLARIIMTPIIIFFYLADFIPYGKLVALIVYVLAWMSDIVDGHIARKYNMVTDLGKLLDPVADKLLVTTVLLLVVVDHTIPAPYGVIFLFIMFLRDYVVSGLRQIGASKNVVMAANWTNKVKSWPLYISCCVAIFLAFLQKVGVAANVIFGFQIFLYILLGWGTAMLIASMIVYLIQNWKVLKDNKKDEKGTKTKANSASKNK